MEINFYGVLQDDVQKVVAVLLEKAYKTNKNSVLLVPTVEEAKSFDARLWSAVSWLPHCLEGDSKEEKAPLVISFNGVSQSINVKNNASFCFVFGESEHYDLEKFEKIYIIFDLRNQNSVKFNRERWKDLQQKNYAMRFYKQNQQGKFEETKL
ncbi:MAG: DNA polymerase III subunit chi [Alphaproteobacteria bacterium]|jgi:DNA polymerase IIIc chi subunit|nr:DNA polymerase III subunit chi [Alphaproteobacteria bacterium]